MSHNPDQAATPSAALKGCDKPTARVLVLHSPSERLGRRQHRTMLLDAEFSVVIPADEPPTRDLETFPSDVVPVSGRCRRCATGQKPNGPRPADTPGTESSSTS